MPSLTDAQLAEIRERVDKATPGKHEPRFVPWGMPADVCNFSVISLLTGLEICRVWQRDDVEFYGAAKQDILALLATVDALRGALESLPKLCRPIVCPVDDDALAAGESPQVGWMGPSLDEAVAEALAALKGGV